MAAHLTVEQREHARRLRHKGLAGTSHRSYAQTVSCSAPFAPSRRWARWRRLAQPRLGDLDVANKRVVVVFQSGDGEPLWKWRLGAGPLPAARLICS
jgi:hypothetical protein